MTVYLNTEGLIHVVSPMYFRASVQHQGHGEAKINQDLLLQF